MSEKVYDEALALLVSGDLAMEELYKLNNRIVDRIKRQRRAENYAAIAKLHIGQRVVIRGNFARSAEWLVGTLGTIVQIRETKIKVEVRSATVADPHAVTMVTVNASNVEPYVEPTPAPVKKTPTKRKVAKR